MSQIKKGDIVARISYKKDIIFIVKYVDKNNNNVLLEGVFERIIADSKIEDLVLIDNKEVIRRAYLKEQRIMYNEYRQQEYGIIGKILHLDGDKRYSEKSLKYYQKMGLNAIVKNISENMQPRMVYNLLKFYKPDILVVTGHDSMIKKGRGYYDLYNYKNSKYFVATVKEARRYEIDNKLDLVIYAGACQSYYEALIEAGANFASSPARILIDILDPLIVAKKIATTSKFRYIRIEDIENDLRDGRKGVGGIGANRKNENFIIYIYKFKCLNCIRYLNFFVIFL